MAPRDAPSCFPSFGGVLMENGNYGLLRFSLPLLPVAAKLHGLYMPSLLKINIVYGAFLFAGSDELNAGIAYSSVHTWGCLARHRSTKTLAGL